MVIFFYIFNSIKLRITVHKQNFEAKKKLIYTEGNFLACLNKLLYQILYFMLYTNIYILIKMLCIDILQNATMEKNKRRREKKNLQK